MAVNLICVQQNDMFSVKHEEDINRCPSRVWVEDCENEDQEIENNPIISGSSIASGSAGGIILRQYSGVLKVVQGLLHPPGSLRGAGHSPMISAVHEIARHVSVVLVGLKLMGMLNPSTSEMSKKSMLLNWFVVNSAMVYGGFPPIEHIIPPQSPV
nr:hypothetical protein C2845_PM04G30420 [Ipomoea batatas]